MPRLELYAFRYRDPLTKKWVRARYVAELREIAARYAEYEVLGPPEIRNVDPHARWFDPLRDEYRADASVCNVGAILPVALPTDGTRRVLIAGTAG
jgi:hypothetical protein